jgi:hypothetical protein
MKVEVSDQVLEFIRSQTPEPRKRLRLALRKLASEQGDIKSLEGPLSGYLRLRVGPYRMLLAYGAAAGQPPCLRCLFAERRDIVYEIFSRLLQERIMGA